MKRIKLKKMLALITSISLSLGLCTENNAFAQENTQSMDKVLFAEASNSNSGQSILTPQQQESLDKVVQLYNSLGEFEFSDSYYNKLNATITAYNNLDYDTQLKFPYTDQLHDYGFRWNVEFKIINNRIWELEDLANQLKCDGTNEGFYAIQNFDNKIESFNNDYPFYPSMFEERITTCVSKRDNVYNEYFKLADTSKNRELVKQFEKAVNKCEVKVTYSIESYNLHKNKMEIYSQIPDYVRYILIPFDLSQKSAKQQYDFNNCFVAHSERYGEFNNALDYIDFKLEYNNMPEEMKLKVKEARDLLESFDETTKYIIKDGMQPNIEKTLYYFDRTQIDADIDSNKNLIANAGESSKVSISKDSMTDVKAEGLDVLFKNNGTVHYDKKALNVINKALASENDADVFINLEKVEKESLGNVIVKDAVDKNEALGVFSVDLAIKNKVGITPIHSFNGGTATISVNFANPNNEKLQVYRVNDDGTLIAMKTSYANGILTWVTDGHSYYMVKVVSDKKVPVQPEDSKDESKPNESKPNESKPNESKPNEDKKKEDKVNTAYRINYSLWITLLGVTFVTMISAITLKKIYNK